MKASTKISDIALQELVNDTIVLEDFLHKFKFSKQIEDFVHRKRHVYTIRSDKKKILLNCPNDISCIIYKRDAVVVQREQVRNTEMKDKILHHSEGKAHTHPLNSDVSAKACEAVEIAVKTVNITEN